MDQHSYSANNTGRTNPGSNFDERQEQVLRDLGKFSKIGISDQESVGSYKSDGVNVKKPDANINTTRHRSGPSDVNIGITPEEQGLFGLLPQVEDTTDWMEKRRRLQDNFSRIGTSCSDGSFAADEDITSERFKYELKKAHHRKPSYSRGEYESFSDVLKRKKQSRVTATGPNQAVPGTLAQANGPKLANSTPMKATPLTQETISINSENYNPLLEQQKVVHREFVKIEQAPSNCLPSETTPSGSVLAHGVLGNRGLEAGAADSNPCVPYNQPTTLAPRKNSTSNIIKSRTGSTTENPSNSETGTTMRRHQSSQDYQENYDKIVRMQKEELDRLDITFRKQCDRVFKPNPTKRKSRAGKDRSRKTSEDTSSSVFYQETRDRIIDVGKKIKAELNEISEDSSRRGNRSKRIEKQAGKNSQFDTHEESPSTSALAISRTKEESTSTIEDKDLFSYEKDDQVTLETTIERIQKSKQNRERRENESKCTSEDARRKGMTKQHGHVREDSNREDTHARIQKEDTNRFHTHMIERRDSQEQSTINSTNSKCRRTLARTKNFDTFTESSSDDTLTRGGKEKTGETETATETTIKKKKSLIRGSRSKSWSKSERSSDRLITNSQSLDIVQLKKLAMNQMRKLSILDELYEETENERIRENKRKVQVMKENERLKEDKAELKKHQESMIKAEAKKMAIQKIKVIEEVNETENEIKDSHIEMLEDNLRKACDELEAQDKEIDEKHERLRTLESNNKVLEEELQRSRSTNHSRSKHSNTSKSSHYKSDADSSTRMPDTPRMKAEDTPMRNLSRGKDKRSRESTIESIVISQQRTIERYERLTEKNIRKLAEKDLRIEKTKLALKSKDLERKISETTKVKRKSKRDELVAHPPTKYDFRRKQPPLATILNGQVEDKIEEYDLIEEDIKFLITQVFSGRSAGKSEVKEIIESMKGKDERIPADFTIIETRKALYQRLIEEYEPDAHMKVYEMSGQDELNDLYFRIAQAIEMDSTWGKLPKSAQRKLAIRKMINADNLITDQDLRALFKIRLHTDKILEKLETEEIVNIPKFLRSVQSMYGEDNDSSGSGRSIMTVETAKNSTTFETGYSPPEQHESSIQQEYNTNQITNVINNHSQSRQEYVYRRPGGPQKESVNRIPEDEIPLLDFKTGYQEGRSKFQAAEDLAVRQRQQYELLRSRGLVFNDGASKNY